MKIDLDKIKEVKPELNYAKLALENVADIVSAIELPDDFNNSDILLVPASARSRADDLLKVENELEKVIDGFSKAESSNIGLSSLLANPYMMLGFNSVGNKKGGNASASNTLAGIDLGNLSNEQIDKANDFVNSIGNNAGQGTGSIGTSCSTSNPNINNSQAGSGNTSTSINSGAQNSQINESSGTQGNTNVNVGNNVNEPQIDESEGAQGNTDVNVDEDINEPQINEPGEGQAGNGDVEVNDDLTFNSADEFFENMLQGSGEYGISQGIFDELKEMDPIQYENAKNLLVNEYKLSETDAEQLLELISRNNDGTYARGVNEICSYFKDKPEEFEEIFGFPLYVQNGEGKVEVNGTRILLDYYFWGNAYSENSALIDVDANGNASLNQDAFGSFNGEEFVNEQGSGWQDLNSYLQWKSENLGCESSALITNQTIRYDGDEIQSILEEHIANGEEISIRISASEPGTPLTFYNPDTNDEINSMMEEHWFKVTDVTEDGIILSGWGEKCMITFDELTENGQYTVISDKFKVK